MQSDLSLYAVLGVEWDATPEEIRGAYRRAARESHPDLHPGDATAIERFKRVQLAYEILGDPIRRAAYDRPPVAAVTPGAEPARVTAHPTRVRPTADAPVSLARELGETVRAIRVIARRSGFARRVRHLIRYLESLERPS